MIQNHPKWAIINSFTEQIITVVRNRQAEYFAQNGEFFQGLRTPAVTQCTGDANISIEYGLHPTDKAASWNTFSPTDFKAATKIPCNISIDVYQSARGWGWILRLEIWKAGLDPDGYGTMGDHWVYQHNEGPELRQGIWDEWHIEPET